MNDGNITVGEEMLILDVTFFGERDYNTKLFDQMMIN